MSVKVIYLQWCDAISDGSVSWHTKQEAVEWCRGEDWLITQVAFLVEETKEYILIAAKCNFQDKIEHRFSGLQKIPKTWIRKRRQIKL